MSYAIFSIINFPVHVIHDAILCYCPAFPVQPYGSDPYPTKFKGVTELIRVANRALDGGYVNFGIFALYGDRALQDLIDAVLNLTLVSQPSELLVRATLL